MNERVPLSFLLTQNRDEVPPVEPTVPFAAIYGEAPKVVTAVLERTCVLAEPSDRYERISVRHELVLVDPAVIEWRVKTSDAHGNRLQSPSGHGRMAQHRQPASKSPWRASPSAPRPADAQAVRDESDTRARKTQQQVRDAEEKEMRFLRQRAAEQALEKEKEEVSIVAQSHAEEPSAIQVVDVPQHVHSVTSEPPAARKVKLRHCHRCGEDKPKNQFKTKRGKGVCETCRTSPKPTETAEVVDTSSQGTKRKYTRRAKAGKRRKSDKAADKIGARVTAPTAHRNGRPSLTFKELIERVVAERDALKTRVDELEAERAQAFAQLQEVLG